MPRWSDKSQAHPPKFESGTIKEEEWQWLHLLPAYNKKNCMYNTHAYRCICLPDNHPNHPCTCMSVLCFSWSNLQTSSLLRQVNGCRGKDPAESCRRRAHFCLQRHVRSMTAYAHLLEALHNGFLYLPFSSLDHCLKPQATSSGRHFFYVRVQICRHMICCPCLKISVI